MNVSDRIGKHLTSGSSLQSHFVNIWTILLKYIIHNTRCSRKHNSQFLQIRHSSNTFGKSFFPTTAKEWNALPSDIISSSSIESFKTKLSKYLLDHYSTHHHAHWRDVPEGHYLPVMQQKQKCCKEQNCDGRCILKCTCFHCREKRNRMTNE